MKKIKEIKDVKYIRFSKNNVAISDGIKVLLYHNDKSSIIDVSSSDIKLFNDTLVCEKNDSLEYIMDDRYELIRDNKKKIFHNFTEQAETVARLLYWGELYSQKSGTMSHQFMGRFYDLSQDREKYDAEFKRCNNYGLDNFKELWEQAKIDRQGETNN